MTDTDTQIKAAYEKNGMTPAEIAEDLSFDVVAVKAKLMQVSSTYRKDCGAEEDNEDGLNFTNDQLRQVNQVIHETALTAEHSDGSVDYRTRLAAATYIRDDKKGRKEAVRAVQHNQFNMFAFNEMLQSAREGAQKIKQSVNNKMIEA